MVRSTAYWESVIAPAVRAGRRVCVCGHENNLRSLLKHLDGVSDEDIVHVELPRAVPLVYHLDKVSSVLDYCWCVLYACSNT
jgi:2,3-bisphosphoglycerate-dependent phosphoglycerate mutase